MVILGAQTDPQSCNLSTLALKIVLQNAFGQMRLHSDGCTLHLDG